MLENDDTRLNFLFLPPSSSVHLSFIRATYSTDVEFSVDVKVRNKEIICAGKRRGKP